MDKKLVIITTDMEIELAMFVDAGRLEDTREVVAKAKDRYYGDDCSQASFEAALCDAMEEHGITFEVVEHEEM